MTFYDFLTKVEGYDLSHLSDNYLFMLDSMVNIAKGGGYIIMPRGCGRTLVTEEILKYLAVVGDPPQD